MTNRICVLLTIALFTALGCAGLLKDASGPAPAKLFECRVEALAPAVAGVFEARDLVREIYAGRASLSSVIAMLGLSERMKRDLAESLAECEQYRAEPVAAAPGTLATL